LQFILLLLCYAPWGWAVVQAVQARGTATSQISWITKPSFGDLAFFFATLNGPFAVRGTTLIGVVLFLAPLLIGLGLVLFGKAERRPGTFPTLLFLSLFAFVPVVLTFLASHVLSQSVWAERSLVIVVAPYALLVAVAIRRLPWAWARTAWLLAVLAWAGTAGVIGLIQYQKIPWDRLASKLSQTESAAGPVRVYASEPFVVEPLRFFFESAGESRFEVVLDRTMSDVKEDHCWIAYRDSEWKQERSAEQILDEKGYRRGPAIKDGSGGQNIILFPVWRQEPR
jgi:hypothetical protein